MLNWPGNPDAIDWRRASTDSISVRAKRGGEHTGPNRTDRGKAGTKYHVLIDRQGVPLAVQLCAASVRESKLLEPLVYPVAPIRRPVGRPGRPRKRPPKLHADKGYDSPEKRRALRRRGITARIARRSVERSEGLDGKRRSLRTGAPPHDLPERQPPYQTCHRRFQAWAHDDSQARVLRALAEDPRERGGLDLSESCIDGTFVVAKQGGRG